MTQEVVAKPDTRFSPRNATTAAYTASLVVKAAPGVLYGLHGYNSGPVQFIQLHDAASLPADGAVPVGPILPVAATSTFSLDFGIYGMQFTSGIIVANSTLGPTKSLGSADCWFHARYL